MRQQIVRHPYFAFAAILVFAVALLVGCCDRHAVDGPKCSDGHCPIGGK